MTGASIGTYCYDIALSKVQFSSDTSQFSPNNVRRLFMSGDGVFVQLFVNTGTGIYKKGIFNPAKAFDCFCDKNFKPIIQCLIDLVCSNLEEIVFCMQSQSGVNLSQAELNLTAILKGYTGSISPDLAKTLLGRFVRLRSITMFNGSLNEVMELAGTSDFRDYSKLFSDCVSDKTRLKEQSLGNAEWYNNSRLRPQHYMLDVQGGKLSKYFSTVKERLESALKSDKITEMNKQRFGKKQEKVNEFNCLSDNMLVCLTKYAKCSKKVGVDASKLIVGLSVPSNLESFGLSKNVSDALSRVSVDTSVKETSEKYDLLISSLAKLSETCYLTTLEMFFEAVKSYVDKKTTLKVKMKGFDPSRVLVPSGVRVSSDVEGLLDCKFTENGTIRGSMAILLAYTCRLNIPASQIRDKSMYEVSYWSGILGRKETK